MVNKRDDGYQISEHGNWNVASEYSKIKIMKPLDNADKYENMALFGYDNILDQIANYHMPTDELRLLGLKRLITELLRLINNTKFAMHVSKTKEKMEGYEKSLKLILQNFDKFEKKQKKINGQVFTTLNTKSFESAVKIVSEIKAQINEPLNENDLIFTKKKTFDPKVYKKNVFDNAVNRG